MITRSIFVVAAFILLGAHFLRGDHRVLVTICLLMPLVLLVRKPWARLAVQWSLQLGALVWFYTLLVLTHSRLTAGKPWGRMFVILAAVAVFTSIAGLLLNSSRIKQRYE